MKLATGHVSSHMIFYFHFSFRFFPIPTPQIFLCCCCSHSHYTQPNLNERKIFSGSTLSLFSCQFYFSTFLIVIFFVDKWREKMFQRTLSYNLFLCRNIDLFLHSFSIINNIFPCNQCVSARSMDVIACKINFSRPASTRLDLQQGHKYFKWFCFDVSWWKWFF